MKGRDEKNKVTQNTSPQLSNHSTHLTSAIKSRNVLIQANY